MTKKVTDLLFTYHDVIILQFRTKRCSGRLLLTGKSWIVKYTVCPFSTAATLSVIFKTTSTEKWNLFGK